MGDERGEHDNTVFVDIAVMQRIDQTPL